MGPAVARIGCGVFMTLVDNHGSLQFSCQLQTPAFMWKIKWDVKIHEGQTHLLIQYLHLLCNCTNHIMSVVLNLQEQGL